MKMRYMNRYDIHVQYLFIYSIKYGAYGDGLSVNYKIPRFNHWKRFIDMSTFQIKYTFISRTSHPVRMSNMAGNDHIEHLKVTKYNFQSSEAR